MSAPVLSWLPARWINSMVDEGTPTLAEYCAAARDHGLSHVEMYHKFLPDEPEALARVGELLRAHGLRVCQITCPPDFTNPDPAVREAEQAYMRRMVDACVVIGAAGCRVTSGTVHEGLSREEGVRLAVEGLARLGEYAAPRGVKLGFENHYQDRRWTRPDFAFHADVFLEIFRGLAGTPVGVNFDCSNQLMAGEDALAVLREVKERVWHVHASDRFPGEYRHSVVGEGAVDFDPLFAVLAEAGFDGYISLEDGNPEGDAGTARGIAFLRRKVEEHWGAPPR
jgi:sugar phosphate isomerase/epimerase